MVLGKSGQLHLPGGLTAHSLGWVHAYDALTTTQITNHQDYGR